MSGVSTFKSQGFKQELDRKLGLWALVAYGLNYMIPLAPAIVFGFVLKQSGGTVALPYLLALVAMIFTGICYCFFLKRVPLCGSASSYVQYAFNSKFLGGLAGWNILLDYVLVPSVTAESASQYIHQLLPFLPFNLILIVFILLCGIANFLNIQSIGRFGILFCIVSEVVLVGTLLAWALAVHHGVGAAHLFSLQPFHYISLTALAGATSLALLSYLGFDAITTLSEEAVNSTRDIPRAIIICLLVGALTMFFTGYLGVLVIPHWQSFAHQSQWLASAVFKINQIAGGDLLNIIYVVFFVVAMAVFNVVAVTGASRLLYAMSRNGLFNKEVARVQRANKAPVVAICLVILVQVLVVGFFRVDTLAELVNFGAISTFCLLNAGLAYVAWRERTMLCIGIGCIGFLINVAILVSMHEFTLMVGLIWTILGIGYFLIRLKKS